LLPVKLVAHMVHTKPHFPAMTTTLRLFIAASLVWLRTWATQTCSEGSDACATEAEWDESDASGLLQKQYLSSMDQLDSTQNNRFIKQVFSIGDSLQDVGLPYGLWSYTNKTLPSSELGYYNGHITNGMTFAEYFEKKTLVGIDINVTSFAAGLATVGPNINDPYHVGSIGDQIPKLQAYVNSLGSKARSEMHPSLCLLNGGGNDINTYASQLNDVSVVTNLMATIVTGLVAMAAMLHDTGHCDHILVSNLPPVHLTPFARAGLGDVARADLKQMIETINAGLKLQIENLQTSLNAKTLRLFDVHAQNTDVILNPKKYGFKISDAACLVAPTNMPPAVSRCNNPEDYVFWDMEHPTTKAHEQMFKDIRTLLRDLGLLPNKLSGKRRKFDR
jgi:phospholipase/lecithinase/hemolysin